MKRYMVCVYHAAGSTVLNVWARNAKEATHIVHIMDEFEQDEYRREQRFERYVYAVLAVVFLATAFVSWKVLSL